MRRVLWFWDSLFCFLMTKSLIIIKSLGTLFPLYHLLDVLHCVALLQIYLKLSLPFVCLLHNLYYLHHQY